MFLFGGFHKKPQEPSQNLLSNQQCHSLQAVLSKGSLEKASQEMQGSPEALHSCSTSGRAGSTSQAGSDPDPLSLPTTDTTPVPDHPFHGSWHCQHPCSPNSALDTLQAPIPFPGVLRSSIHLLPAAHIWNISSSHLE